MGTSRGGSGRWVLLFTALLLASCSRTFELQTVNTPVVERRVQLDANAPLVTSDWTLEGAHITGHVVWSTCESHRTWRTEQRRTMHQRANSVAAALLIGGGLVTGVVGAATYKGNGPVKSCMHTFDDMSCTSQVPDNIRPQLMLSAGVLAISLGITALTVPPSDSTKTLSSEPHSETSTFSCIPPSDLPVLSLVLKLGEGKFLHMALEPNGHASIELPQAVHLRPGAAVPIVVYRVPPGAKRVLKRWQVVGVVRAPAAE